MWDTDTARRYDAWFSTPGGAFALGREIRLLERMTAGWPRRGQRLLEIGCGTGIFLEVLHQAGFDVAGLDKSPAMLEAARTRMGALADLHLGDAEHLPFDDNEFDFAVLFTVLEFCPDPAQALREAARVARKGLIIGYLNRLSLHWLFTQGLPGRRSGSLLGRARWFLPWEMRHLAMENLGRRPYVCRCVLPGPLPTWRDAPLWRQLNAPILPLPIGAFCAARVDLLGDPARIPLHALKAKPGIG
ncbi:class I SAM-dependent methyltransferase [Desulfolutivibrio sulfoxidireducens]|uniref:class I SAM-dependent methyltransferase n=1 Tax=Desulfolutivibrio sulfoxidireducens TaxID=2773299 RepID=UPI00159E17D0|nr:class I SAM-dependent methyltransferase [Desulfolutivibrio sulfoxidireducens]QLA14722.1 methyltransferase domain-containing protein [Desulfolutivibrio sulfoxidireducens]QLA18303.1 methyltransferase domain-containing protein [Desulfolutivibrio sulfoxidireducens]